MGLNKMKSYACDTVVNAREMTRGEYNVFRGWDLPNDESCDDAGYLVDYGNYITWLDSPVFERCFIVSDNFIDRLAIEINQLDSRIEKLKAFIDADDFTVFDESVQSDFKEQLFYMKKYSDVLHRRYRPYK